MMFAKVVATGMGLYRMKGLAVTRCSIPTPFTIGKVMMSIEQAMYNNLVLYL